MKNHFIIRLFLFIICFVHNAFPTSAQNIDSLWKIYKDKSQPDTTRFRAVRQIVLKGYMETNPDSAFYFAQVAYEFAKSKGMKKKMANSLKMMGDAVSSNNPEKALTYFRQALKICEEGGFKKIQGAIVNQIGITLFQQMNYSEALVYYQRSLEIHEELGDKRGVAASLINMGLIYRDMKDFPKALDYLNKGAALCEEIGDNLFLSNAMRSIGYIYYDQHKFAQSLQLYQRSLDIDRETGKKDRIVYDLDMMGAILSEIGDFPRAIDCQNQSLAIYKELGDQRGIADEMNGIGSIYQQQKNYAKAREYFQQSLPIYEDLDVQIMVAGSNINIGLTYVEEGDYDKAILYIRKGMGICEKIGEQSFKGNALSNIGLIYQKQGDYTHAMENYQQAYQIFEGLNYKDELATQSNRIGAVYNLLMDPKQAKKWCEKGLTWAEELGVLTSQKEACQCLYAAEKALGNGTKALEYHERMLALDDSLNATETAKKLQQMEFAKQVLADSLKNEEARLKAKMESDEKIHRESRGRNIAIVSGLFFLVLAGGFYFRWRYVKKSKAVIEKEKDRSEHLLLNILPEEVAKELKDKGESEAKDFETVTVLFTDFVHFTQAAEKLTAKELVGEINTCFKAFDEIIGKYHLEKIKTIGDAYMAAGGLHVPSTSEPKDVVLAALEMQQFILNRKAELEAQNRVGFDMRAGIHTGPVVAGIVGVKKFQYDIWGDTVNTASRMESSGEAGKVNISETTFELVKDYFNCVPRGKISAKGKGEMEMYFVES
ncbi:MAG: tetratricopeptide repeat protein [Bacteroidetes bacterium]|nr:tetratricopeptide repeat protein [Bacteroidota bacterium]